MDHPVLPEVLCAALARLGRAVLPAVGPQLAGRVEAGDEDAAAEVDELAAVLGR